jgi:hypothetical protein
VLAYGSAGLLIICAAIEAEKKAGELHQLARYDVDVMDREGGPTAIVLEILWLRI